MAHTILQRPASSPLVEPSSLELPAPGGGGDRDEGNLPYQLAIINRWRWQIATLVLLAVVGTLLVTSKLHKQYQSTVLIRVDPSSPRVVGQDQQNASSAGDQLLVTTEEHMLTSDDVVGEAVDALRLQDKGEFAPSAQERLTITAAEARRKAIRSLIPQIAVAQPLSTLLLSVSVRTASPEMSAAIANAVAAALLDHEYRTRQQAVAGSARYMAAQLDGLRARMESAQAALVQYEIQEDVLNPDDKTNLLQTRLQQTNEDLGKAQSQRINLQSEYVIAGSGDLSAALATEAGARLIPLQQKLQADQLGLGRLGQIYGPSHPLYQQQAAAVASDQAALEHQRGELVAQLGNGYRAAAAREALLAGLVAQQKRDLDNFNLRAVRYSILKGEADSDAKLYYDLLQSTKEADVSAGFHSADGLRVVNSATPDPKPVAPRILLDSILALVLSLGAGCGGALLLAALDHTLSSPEQAEGWLGLRVIGWLPSVARAKMDALRPFGYAGLGAGQGPRESALRKGADAPFHEAILALQSTLLFGRGEAAVFLITSALPGEGKSTVTANLAAALASSGTRTLLIDADLRKPKVHRVFGLPNLVGLTDVLRGEVAAQEAVRRSPGAPGLDVLTAGTPVGFSVEILQRNLGPALERLRAEYDFILLDCPPVLGLADSVAISNLADSVLLLARAGSTDRRLVAAAARQLRTARAPLSGLLLNQVRPEMNKYYAYYDSYASYYGGGQEADDED